MNKPFKFDDGLQKKMWGARFKGKTHPLMEKFGASVHFDKKLAAYDIEGSIAHARMLARAKIIEEKDAQRIVEALKGIMRSIENNQFQWDEKLEDVHTNIDAVLRRKVGDVADRLHTARSRNDQVVLDTKLYLMDHIKKILQLIRLTQKSFLKLAKANSSVIIPGYTHLQRAQGVLLAHHLLAYVEMLDRDAGRFDDALRRMDVLPLGACALAGTSFDTDRRFLAQELGFSCVSDNSMDDVSDRDFLIEAASDLAIVGLHLSRFSEELILWSSFEFQMVELPDAFTTGSSAMPQKKNPDALELTRGKTGRLLGNWTRLAVILKGLPLTYNRDLQEDKEAIFDSVDTVISILEIFAEMIPHIRFNPEALIEREDFTSSLDLAEYLVRKGVSFRQAHEIVGHVVLHCLDKKKTFKELSLEEVRLFSEAFEKDFRNCLGWEASVRGKRSWGSTRPEEVAKNIKKWERKLRQ